MLFSQWEKKVHLVFAFHCEQWLLPLFIFHCLLYSSDTCGRQTSSVSLQKLTPVRGIQGFCCRSTVNSTSGACLHKRPEHITRRTAQRRSSLTKDRKKQLLHTTAARCQTSLVTSEIILTRLAFSLPDDKSVGIQTTDLHHHLHCCNTPGYLKRKSCQSKNKTTHLSTATIFRLHSEKCASLVACSVNMIVKKAEEKTKKITNEERASFPQKWKCKWHVTSWSANFSGRDVSLFRKLHIRKLQDTYKKQTNLINTF